MNILQSIELFTALNLFAVGLSHFLRPLIWVDFFEYLHSRGNVGNIFNALMALAVGSFILSFHFIWEWPVVMVTLYGVLSTIKGIIYLLFPAVGLKSIGNVNAENANKFRWVGLAMVVLSIWIGYSVFGNLSNAF